MRALRIPATLAAALSTVLFGGGALAACSSGTSASQDTAVATAAAAPPTARASGGGGRQPGVSGLVAAVSGSTMQVQSQTKQTAVTWTTTTAFTKQEAGTEADVTVGTCAAVRPAGGAPATGDTVAAATVQITPTAADGTCTGGFGGGLPQAGATVSMPSGAPSGMPTGAPGGVPTGAPTGGPGPSGADGRGAGGGLFGKVTAVSGASFTVTRVAPGGGTGSATPVTVTTNSSSAYTKTVQANAKDVAVGQCATAQGQTSDTGAVTATTATLRVPVNGSCFGGGTSGTAGGATGE